MDYSGMSLEQMVAIMEAENGHKEAIWAQIGVWTRAHGELVEASSSITGETAALQAGWDDVNGEQMVNAANRDASVIGGWRDQLGGQAPWHRIQDAGEEIGPTYAFVKQQYELAKPLIAQLAAVDNPPLGLSDPGWAAGAAMLASQIEAYRQAAAARITALGKLFDDAAMAVTAAVNGDIWLSEALESAPADAPLAAVGPGTPAGGGVSTGGMNSAALSPGGVPDTTPSAPQTAPDVPVTPSGAAAGGATAGAGAASAGGGAAPSLAGGASAPTLPSTAVPAPGGTGPGGLTPPTVPPIGGGPGVGPAVPPMIPPIGGAIGSGRVPAANVGGAARIPGVNLGGLGNGAGLSGIGGGGVGGIGGAGIGGGGAGIGPAAIPQAASPVGAPAQVAPSGPPPAWPSAVPTGAATAAGTPMMPPMMPPMAGAGAGGATGTGPGPGAARSSATGRGRGSQNPTPGMPAMLTGKAGKGNPHPVPPRARRIRETDAPATVELIDEDLWQVGEQRGEPTRPPARIHRH
ncbi:hypothetical protein ACFP2T_39240 [Plantactinospora solaniradicis]|uniref:PPE domain-containing protein n=1 Tax=Plantactinospora solaniradicis TaxID=1723736 RepID=A0ABW1KK73_9ACTN